MTLRNLFPKLVLGLCLTLTLAACDSGSEDEATTGNISGQLTLPAGVNGTVANAALQVYDSFSDYDAGAAPLRTAAADAEGTFEVESLNPGNYFLIGFKDNDNDGIIDGGDFLGFSGGIESPGNVEVIAGETAISNIVMQPFGGGGGDPTQAGIAGTILNTTSNPVQNALINLIPQDGSAPLSFTTGADGAYDFDVPAGQYTLTIERPGYNIQSLPLTVNGDETEDFRISGPSDIFGTLTSSQGGPLANAEVNFVFSSDVTGDPIESRFELTTTTDANGNYQIEGAPFGTFTSVTFAENHFPVVVEDVVFEEGETEIPPVTATEQPDAEALRVVLTWGEDPGDLDSHLTGPDGQGGRFHVYFSDRSFGDTNLDVDDTSSFGPETITIYPSTDGVYRYSVFNYSDDSENGAAGIAASPTRVEVYSAEGLVRSYTAPPAQPGNTWRVFEMYVEGNQISFNGSEPSGLGYVTASGSSDTGVFRSTGKSLLPLDAIGF